MSPPPMLGFEPGGQAVVVGAAGGIGAALVSALLAEPAFACVTALSRQYQAGIEGRLCRGPVDVMDETSIRDAASALCKTPGGPIRLVIVATGGLHGGRLAMPEKSYRTLDPLAMVESYRLNAVGPALVAKHLLPLLAVPGRSVFAVLSARIGSIGDNRSGGWHAYRASKAALTMILRNLAIETARRAPGILCVGLHPGTVDTGLSRPFQRGVPDGRLFDPAVSARHLLDVIGGLDQTHNGCVLAWDGSIVPP